MSFFLILFYQNRASILSASFTLLINRLGDALLILTILILGFSQPFLGFVFTLKLESVFLLTVFLLGLMTKRALFPFSPWLPAAMAAPTPISSLVHSSTLVTAGLYLMMRNFVLLSMVDSFLFLLVVVGLFTSLYAGLRSLVETDLKKVVALSTLRHLGFICYSLGLGWCSLAFLHLLAHAFFKSSLFIALGTFIASQFHYQESRYFSSFGVLYPVSSSVILVSEANLLGLPFLRGFYSKDLVLESMSYSFLGYFIVFVSYFNLFFTFIYSFRILISIFGVSRLSAYVLGVKDISLFTSLLTLLSLFSTVLSLFLSFCPPYLLPLLPIPLVLKFLPFATLLIMYFIFLFSLKRDLS